MADSGEVKKEGALHSTPKTPTYDELVQLVGQLEPVRLAQIERLQATIAEIEEAVAYAAGADDVMGEERIPLSGRAAQVYDIITAEQAFEEDR